MVQRSFASMLKKVEEDLDKIRTEFLKDVAEDLVLSSPIDTGTYVRNHSITVSSGAGGRQNSHGKPKDTGQAAPEALNKLFEQIDGLPNDTTTVHIANRSPYANKVEYGGWEGKAPYQVYTSVRQRAPLHLAAAISRVKGSQ